MTIIFDGGHYYSMLDNGTQACDPLAPGAYALVDGAIVKMADSDQCLYFASESE